MNINELIVEGYLAYEVPEHARQDLVKKYPPKFPEFIAHHITKEFGVPQSTPEETARIKLIGYAEEDGLEVLVVEVNGSRRRDDGAIYHITWSLDRSKGKKPVMSNDLIRKGDWQLVEPYEFHAPLRFFQ